MDMASYDKYVLTDDKEKTLWEDCYFVFDSSVLLDFYSYPETTRNEIYTDIFDKIKSKLWIPAYVQYEYLKNRESVIKKPVNEKYIPSINVIEPIINYVEQTRMRLKELNERTKDTVKHPHTEQSDILGFRKIIEKYADDVIEFDKNVKEKIEKQKEEILRLKQKDPVLDNFNQYFAVGEEYSFERILEITKEGKHRYEFKIPPGYEDCKEKEGLQIFGDLIIWKQLLDFAYANKSNIVFVCNDLKNDWCVLDATTSEKRIKSPREELIKEFSDKTGNFFWMYSQDQFIYKSNKILGSKISNKKIEQIFQVMTARLTHIPDRTEGR